MLENFFLNYANYSLREDPEYLRMFVSDITCREDNYVQEDVDKYSDIAEAIIFIVKKKEEKIRKRGYDSFGIETLITIAKKIPYLDRKQLIDVLFKKYGLWGKVMEHFLIIYDIAFQTVNGVLGCGYCEHKLYEFRCKLFGQDIGQDLHEGPDGLKCYECDQLHLNHILSEIVNGKEYNSIEWFEFLIQFANDNTKIRREFSLGKAKKTRNNPFDISLESIDIVEFPLRVERKLNKTPTCFSGINPFRGCLVSAWIYSLTEFLQKNDRRKLKRCEQCKDFYEANTIRKEQKYCSKECKRAKYWPPERWAEYMRERRKKEREERQKTKEVEGEKEIQRRMRDGWTREELIEQMKCDAEL